MIILTLTLIAISHLYLLHGSWGTDSLNDCSAQAKWLNPRSATDTVDRHASDIWFNMLMKNKSNVD